MAETEKVRVLNLEINDTTAVKSIKELRENISALKKAINEADEGTPFSEVQTATQQLREQQRALRDAMYSSTGTFQDVTAAAKGTGQSYNALVAQMANLKTQLRAVDTSTETGVAQFKTYAKQINDINTRLKQMDALQGNYQRNVGMYTQKIANMGNAFQATAGAASGMINPIKGATTAFQTLSATPVIGILGLLANIITKVIASMSKGEAETGKLTQAFAGFQAIGDLVTKGLQALGNAVAWVVDKMGKLIASIAGANEQQEKRIALTERELELAASQRETTMRNAEAERDIAELRAKAADKEMYTASQRLEFTKQAADLENEIAKRSYEDLKTQYEIIKAKNSLATSTTEELKEEADAYAAMVRAETEYYNRIRTNNREQARLRKEMAGESKAAAKEAEESNLADWKAALALGEKRAEDARKLREQQQKEMDEWVQGETDSIVAEIEEMMEAEERWNAFEEKLAEERKKRAEEEAKARISAMQWAANATSSILGSLADMYETNGKDNEKNAKRIKGLRIAGATIDMLQGVVTAIAQAQSVGPFAAPIVAAVNSAMVMSAGLANIAKIRATDATGKSTTSAATASAPAPVLQVPQVRTLTTQSDETRLNEMIDDVQVYILESDIEAHRKSNRARVRESSF